MLADQGSELVGGVQTEGRGDLLGAVQIEHDDAEAAMTPGGLRHTLVEQGTQPPAIGKPRDRVDACDRRLVPS